MQPTEIPKDQRKPVAFSLKFSGSTYEKISEVTGYSEYTLRKYFSTYGKWHGDYMDWKKKESETLSEELHGLLLIHAREAANTLVTMVRSPNANAARLKATNSILDRAGIKVAPRS